MKRIKFCFEIVAEDIVFFSNDLRMVVRIFEEIIRSRRIDYVQVDDNSTGWCPASIHIDEIWEKK